MQSEAQYALLELFRDGGFMMYFLVLASLLALGVIIAKAYILFVAHRDSRRLLEQVSAGHRGLDGTIEVAEETQGPVAAILASGLRRVRGRGHSDADIEKAVSTTGAIELGFLERGLVVLATVANVAPMMGFLGTVVGMIAAFGAVAEAGQIEASLVAGGIKVALITTATGLTIAIPVNIAYNFFVTRIDRLIIDMEQGAEVVMDMTPALRAAASAYGSIDPKDPRLHREGPPGGKVG
ncbi:MAG: MotA/TolQ/ExbB proton channel family protein [Gemmatimonadota bacterium]|nr:MAG: MotA/TolQ/ExbB proton channel family protein [Gemmatimonadota bacterium]